MEIRIKPVKVIANKDWRHTQRQNQSFALSSTLLFLLAQLARLLLLLFWIVWPVGIRHVLRYFARLCLLACCAPVFVFIQVINFIGHALDELLFRDYRLTRIRNPVFIVGVPRSGTTYVHRTIAKNPVFTTTSAIDCLLTPSVSQRKLLRLAAKLDTLAGRPIGRLVGSVESWVISRISDNHDFSLHDAEEDFLFLTGFLQCFLLVLPFPKSQWLWDFSCADRNPHSIGTRLTLRWYRMCVRKHLYCNPQASRYLSKNPTFSGIAHLLSETFPDSQLIVCERDAEAAVRSQFRVLAPLRRILSGKTQDSEFDHRLLDTLHFYYSNLDSVKMSLPGRRVRAVLLWQLSVSPFPVFQSLFQWLEHPSEEKRFPALEALSFVKVAEQNRKSIPNKLFTSLEVEAALERFLPWQIPEEKSL